MKRKVADGTAFEREFEKTFSGSLYVKRLRTPNTGYAGVREPADFILVGNCFNYVELKETSGDAFSISTMEQFDLMKEFIETKKALGASVGVDLQYYVVVHFLSSNSIKVVCGETALYLAENRKTLRPNSFLGWEFSSLENMKEGMLF